MGDGRRLPFVVRVEAGTINRAIYQIAFVHDSGRHLPDRWRNASAWNGHQVYRFGGGCRAGHRQGHARSAQQDIAALRKGYAVALSSQNAFGNNCNDVISAETMMMVKEHFIESFGVPDHTIGVGGCGRSMQQHLIAQNYPGPLEGIIPGASYPDPVTLVGPVTDCSLLNRAFEGNVHPWTPARKTAVSGFATRETCASWMRTYSPSMVKPHSCPGALPSDLAYDLERNPDGARCGCFDNVVNLIGCQTLAVAGIVLRGAEVISWHSSTLFHVK